MSTVATFRNPVIPGFHPDPSICRVGDRFYLVTSSFEYFPGIPIFESDDLVSWTQVGFCLPTTQHVELAEAGASKGVFAPTIRWHDGVYFVTATNVSGRGHFIVHASDPRGPWSEPVWIDQDGIDPSLFFEDGTAYFHSNVQPDPGGQHEAKAPFRRGIQQCTLDPFTGQKLTESRFLWEGSGGRFPEAPHLYKREGLYYLLAAEGGTERGHMVTVARSTSPWGPFHGCPRNPVLTHRSSASPFQSMGHADLVELQDGSWWAVLLGTRPEENWHHLGRETFLAPVAWDEEGWPVFGHHGEILPTHARPGLPASPVVSFDTHEDFADGRLGSEWNTLRVPQDQARSFTDPPGWLAQYGTSATTSDPACVLLARRVQHRFVTASAVLDADAVEAGEAGLIVRIDEHHHAEVAISADAEGRALLVRRRIGPVTAVSRHPCPEGRVVLRIELSPDVVSFGYRADGAWHDLRDDHGTRYLSSEVAGGFTGTFIGMYVAGSRATARWRRFDYEGTDDLVLDHDGRLDDRDAPRRLRDRDEAEAVNAS